MLSLRKCETRICIMAFAVQVIPSVLVEEALIGFREVRFGRFQDELDAHTWAIGHSDQTINDRYPIESFGDVVPERLEPGRILEGDEVVGQCRANLNVRCQTKDAIRGAVRCH